MRMIFRVMMATLVLVLPTTLPSAQEAEQQAILKTLQQVRANAAGVRQLVLYHLVPTPVNGMTEDMFKRGLSGNTILAHDLQTFSLPPNSDEIIIR